MLMASGNTKSMPPTEYKWHIVDVTRRAIEEVALEILDKMD
jgi:regulator of PEP synthase PpsR (kinase-PPPase family)